MSRLIKASGKIAIVMLAVVAMTFALADSKQAAGKEVKGSLSAPQIRQAAQKGLTILEVTNKDWIQTGYCYSCHRQDLSTRIAVSVEPTKAGWFVVCAFAVDDRTRHQPAVSGDGFPLRQRPNHLSARHDVGSAGAGIGVGASAQSKDAFRRRVIECAGSYGRRTLG